MLADFLYGLLIVSTVVAVIAIFRLVRRLRHAQGVPSERLLILTMVMLCLLAILFFVLKSQVDGWRGSEPSVDKSESALFVEKVYPPLADAQIQLEYQLKQLGTLQQQIVKLSRHHPQQSSRLQLAYQTWKTERQALMRLRQKVDQIVRSAMGAHRISDQSIVESAFNQEAVDWAEAINTRLAEYQNSQLKITNSLIDNVMLQSKKLSNQAFDRPDLLTASRTVMKSEFVPVTVDELLDYADATTPDVAERLRIVGGEISVATRKRREVRNYLLKHPDLQLALSRVIQGWLQQENRGIFYRDQLLHAIQADYLAVMLGSNKTDNQLLRLRRLVSERSLQTSQSLTQSRTLLEKSYRTGPR